MRSRRGTKKGETVVHHPGYPGYDSLPRPREAHARRRRHPDSDVIEDVNVRPEAFVGDNAPELRVSSTDVSVDIVPPGITKCSGLVWLTEYLGVATEEVVYVGDANSDVDAFSAVGTSFAPANTTTSVCRQADHVNEKRVLQDTLQAYPYCCTQT